MSRPIDHLKRYGESLADAVSPARSRVVAMRAIARAERRPRRSGLRIAAATAGFFAIANVAAAGVADQAVPGDPLYPLDRAYERVADLVGLGGDRTDERLHEATVLVERSDLTTAVDLVDEAVDDQAVAAAILALEQAEGLDADLGDAVMDLINGAQGIADAAREGDRDALAQARDEMRRLAGDVADAARANEREGPTDEPGPPEDIDPPGRDGTPPGDTAPGKDGTPPGDTAPGKDGTPPGDTAPGQSGDRPGQSSSQPGQGNPPPDRGNSS